MKKKSTYAGENEGLGIQTGNIKTPREIQMSSVLHHTGQLTRADAAVAQGAKTATSWVWTRLLCAHRSEQATPLKDTSTYSHTLKKLSALLHKGHSLQQPPGLAHPNLRLGMRMKPGTYIYARLYLESQFSGCAIYTRTGPAKWWSDYKYHLLPVILTERCVDFHTNSI